MAGFEGSVAPASSKLGIVLDYLPCEACLAQPVAQQDLLCSVCRRLDRQIGVRVAVRTTFLLDRPSVAQAEPVIIPPPPAIDVPRVDVRFVPAGERAPKFAAQGAPIEVLLEPYAEPIEEAAPLPRDDIPPPPPPVEQEPVFDVDDIVAYEPTSDLFDFTPADPAARAVAPPPEPVREPEAPPVFLDESTPVAGAEMAQDDFVFRPPPPVEEKEPPTREAEPIEDWMPTDEVRVESDDAPDASDPWSRPPEDEPVLQEAPQGPAPEPEPMAEPQDAPLAMELVDEEEVLTTEVIEDEPAPAPEPGETDLWRLRGFEREADERFAAAGIRAISHLAGHDPGELSERTGVSPQRVTAWIHVADLTQDVGVPLDAALALVAAGVAGPRGLREADPDDIVERVRAFGGGEVAVKDVKRWKRRA